MSERILYLASNDKLGEYLLIYKDGERAWLVAVNGWKDIPSHFMDIGMRGNDVNPMIIWEKSDLKKIETTDLPLYLHWPYKSVWFEKILTGY